MNLNLPDLPPGWHLHGVWHDGFEKDETRAYTADASFLLDVADRPSSHLGASTYGASIQDALDKLPAECARVVRKVVESKEWIEANP